MTSLPLFGKVRITKLPDDVEEVGLDEEGKIKLEALNKALSDSKTSNNSSYASWVGILLMARVGSDIEFEAMLSYWLSWYVLPGSPEMALIPTFFYSLSGWLKERSSPLPAFILVLFATSQRMCRYHNKTCGAFLCYDSCCTAFLQLF